MGYHDGIMTYRIFFRELAQDVVLNDVVARSEVDTVSILDLDGCLFDTRFRQIAILRAWAERTGEWRYAQVTPDHFVDRDLAATVQRAGVPAQVATRDIASLRAFWLERFFDDTHLLCDPPLPGAAAFTRELRSHGATVVYLTARHSNMRPATELALQRFDFPWDTSTHLITKDDPAQSDEDFKRGALEHIATLGRVTVALDNEPANVNLFADRFPDALTVRVDTDCGTEGPLREGIREIRGFLRTTQS